MIGRVIRTLNDPKANYEVDSLDAHPKADYLDEADLITSEIDEYATTHDPILLKRVTEHAPVLDIDFPAAVYPSTTPGKFHLWLDKRVPHDKYMALLDALADAGIIEPGYADVSKKRGYTAVRLPWVEKV